MVSTAVFGAGCFWGVEVLFEAMLGVSLVTSGYSGGHTDNPTYREILKGDTGHIEVVQIEYDNEIITYDELLDKFFFIHDPTTLDRQGPDVGEQYKSIIFYNDNIEKKLAEEKIIEVNQSDEFEQLVVTELRPAAIFYPAEEYHQNYSVKNNKICYQQLYVQYKNSPIP